MFLYQQVVGGECVVFAKGAEVKGSPVETNASFLHVQGEIDPPGYIAPASDFKPKGQMKSAELDWLVAGST